MNDLFDNIEKKPQEVKPAIKVTPEKVTIEKGNLKRTAVIAALIFLVPFCLALLFAVVAKRVSPAHIQQREGIATEQAAEANVPAYPHSDADVAELLEYRNTLRKRGEPVEFANIRLWEAAGRESVLLFKILPPGIGEWSWSISQCGRYAMAIEKNEQETLIRKVALYNFMDEKWGWQQKLPWPENYEDPWIFGRHLILRSSKNNRRFAMELDEMGKIISLDSLGSGSSYIRKTPKITEEMTGEPIAMRSNVIFVSDNENNSLKGYTKRNLPGLFSIGALADNACVSGNGLLKFIANDGAIFVRDAFTEKKLAIFNAWIPSTNTVVKGIESSRDGSSVTIYLKSSFHYDKPLERNWCLTWKPADNTVQANMTNAPSFTPAAKQTEIDSKNLDITLSLRGNNMLEIRKSKSNSNFVTIDLSRYISCDDHPVQSLSLLEDERFLLIKQSEQAYLLDLFSVKHYAELLDKMEQCNRMLDEYSDEKLSRTNIAANAMREVKGEDRDLDGADNFNYEMKDYQTDFMRPQDLEPPAKPSILSLQAEFYATHHAWLYAADKLERLMLIQENDNRAPKANPLLLAQYSLLSGDTKRAKKACDKGLKSIFYDDTPYNRMIHWQMLRILFEK